MTSVLYFSIAAAVMVTAVAVSLAMVDYHDGSVDSEDVGIATFIGLLIGLIWIAAIPAFILSGIGYVLFLFVKVALAKYADKKS